VPGTRKGESKESIYIHVEDEYIYRKVECHRAPAYVVA